MFFSNALVQSHIQLILAHVLTLWSFVIRPSDPTVSAKVVFRGEPVHRVSNYIHHCWLSQAVECEVEPEMMFEEEWKGVRKMGHLKEKWLGLENSCFFQLF